MAEERKFKTTAGLQEVLVIMIDAKGEDVLKRVKVEILEGVLSRSTRDLLVALGWITPRDTRVTTVDPRPRKPAISEEIG